MPKNLENDFLQRAQSVIASEQYNSQTLMKVIADELAASVGIGLVTITAVDPQDQSYERLFSSMPDIYPVAGRKPANPTKWSETVLEKKESYVANDQHSLAEVMFDHELIVSLGLESILNVPIVYRGQVIGTLNCLAGAGHFTPDVISQCEAMALPVVLALIDERRRV